MAGEYGKLLLSAEELYTALEDHPVVMMESLPTSRRPLVPRGLLGMTARQLSSYGGSLETAVTDLEHYRGSGSAVLRAVRRREPGEQSPAAFRGAADSGGVGI